MALLLPLEEFKIQLKNLVSKGLGSAIQELKHHLPSNSKKYNEVIQLESQLNMANLNQRTGIVSYSELQVTYNQIRWSLTNLIDGLREVDFEVSVPDSNAKKSKRGSILYQIPGIMELNEEKKCVVRLAFKEEYLLENIELTEDTKIESIRIAEVMAVELLDPNAQAAFAIRTLNSHDQFIDDDDYSEWIFMVKPLLEGTYPLVLKVSVLEIKQGKERRREIVLEEMITITIESMETEATFSEADYTFQSQGTQKMISPAALDNINAPKSSPSAETIVPIPTPSKSNSSFRRYVPVLLFLLISSIGSWALDLPQEVNWLTVKWKDTDKSYTNYIEKYGAEGRYTEEATFKRATIENTTDALEDYIVTYPDGSFVREARNKAAQLKYEQLIAQFGTINAASEISLISQALTAWRDYQLNYPNSDYQASIASRISDLEQILNANSLSDADLAAYQLALSKNTIVALEEYLRAYPNGQFQEEARDRIKELENSIVKILTPSATDKSKDIVSEPVEDLDKMAYERAKTLEDLKQYLKDFPNGKYIVEAKQRIAALEEVLKQEAEEKANVPIYSTFKDSRDGQVYKTVHYKGQTWMAENLNYNAKGSYCYKKNETNCYKYGRLYPWDVAYYACPKGWHLPSDKEWRNFTKQFGGCDDDASDGGRAAFMALAGEKIQFNIGFGGERDAESQFQNIATYANYWTITPYATSNAYYYYFAGSNFQLKRSKSYKKYSFSCRCMKN